MKGIPKMSIIDHETVLDGGLLAISILVEYDRELSHITHDTLYVIYKDGEPPFPDVTYDEALELAEKLCDINR